MSEQPKKRRGRPRKNPLPEKEPTQEVENVEKVETVEPIETPVVSETDNGGNDDFGGEEFGGTQGSFNPLADNVVEREYATPKTIETAVDDIPEPVYDQNVSFDDLMNSGNEQQEPEPSRFENPNEAYNDLEDADKRLASEQLVDTFLDVVKIGDGMLCKAVQISEDKIAEMKANDEIDFNMGVPTPQGDEMTVDEFFFTYNQQCEEALEVDEEFYAKIRTPLVNMAMRKGWGITEGQKLIVDIGLYLVSKIGIVIQLRRTLNSTLNAFRDVHTQNKEMIPTSETPKRPSEPQRPEQQPQQEEVVEQYEAEEVMDEQLESEKLVIQEFKPHRPDEYPKEIQKEVEKEVKAKK